MVTTKVQVSKAGEYAGIELQFDDGERMDSAKVVCLCLEHSISRVPA